MSTAEKTKPKVFKRKFEARQIKEPQAPNPYVSAKRTWNDHVGSVITAKQTWQFIGVLSLLIAFAAVGGIVYIGSQSKYIPYVIEVDKFGQVQSMGPIAETTIADTKVVGATVAKFIENSRLVTPDVSLQSRAVFDIYAHLYPNSPAITKMTEFLGETSKTNPFLRARTAMVNIDITSVMPQTPETWQIDWIETTRNRQGTVIGEPQQMRALVTVFTASDTREMTEEHMRYNPLGIYVKDYTWSLLK